MYSIAKQSEVIITRKSVTLASTYTLVYYLMSQFFDFSHIEKYGVVPPIFFISLNYLSTFTDRYTPYLYNINV